VRRLVGPALERLGWDPGPDEPERTGTLRAILVKAMTQFPSPQFNQALHLINPSSQAANTELADNAVSRLRDRTCDVVRTARSGICAGGG